MSVESIEAIRSGVVVGLAAIAAVSDLRTRTIPNRWTLPALVLALGLAGVAGGERVLLAAAGVGLAAAVGGPLWMMGALGGGDVKLLVAMGALLEPRGFLIALLYMALVGGGLAVYGAMQTGTLPGMIKDTAALGLNLVTLGARGRRKTLGTPAALTVPYGVAIAVGAVIARIGSVS